ncbi:MAG: RIP metalloprotease RseP [Saprospiraceae bacterium]|nr:RIP metalloprotease RseP [Saprospiraceae bacterium]
MGVLIIILQLILSLSILVILHELGHFLPAKWFKTRVEKFYLFFDPWFSLWKTKKGETEYGVGWLPLGGYVKISGMIDESMDTEQMKQPPQPWEFRSKPAWQRLIIMLGGVTVNFILGFLIFAMIFLVWGEKYLPNSEVQYGIHVDSIAYDMGLRNGDHLVSINGEPVDRFSDRDLLRAIVIDNARQMVVQRDGQEVTLAIDPRFVSVLSSNKNKGAILFEPRIPYFVHSIAKGYPAEQADIQPNDRIVSLNGTPTTYFDQFYDRIKDIGPDQTVTIGLEREGVQKEITLETNDKGRIGVYPIPPADLFELKTIKYSLAEALPKGVTAGIGFLSDQLKAFGQMFRGKIKASESLGGFGTIASLFPEEWHWESFWRVTAILSLILGFMNLLPIPALDGGHVLFLLYEVVSGRKPSDKFMEYATIAGFVLIIGLVLYANGLDILRWFHK